MTRRILVSSSTANQLEYASQWLDSGDGGQAVIVAVSRGAAHDFALECSRGKTGRLGVHFVTPVQLAVEIATPLLARQGRNLVTPTGAEALAARAVSSALKSATLDYFEPVADTPGFARALSSTLMELRLEEVDPALLAQSGPPGRDLAQLLTGYEEVLRQARLGDLATVHRAALDSVGQTSARFNGLPLLLLQISPRRKLQLRFLKALADASPTVLATALEGDEEGIAHLETILKIRAERIPATGWTARAGNRLQRLRGSLFSDATRPDAATIGDDASLEFFSEPGEGREAVEIARKIRFAADQGIRFDQMAVVLRSPQTYIPLLEDALERAGVPACFSHGSVRPDPAGRAFLALLECASEGLSASRFAEYLSLGQVPFPDTDGAPRQPSIAWVTPRNEQLTFKTPVEEPPAEPREKPVDVDRDPVVAGSLRTPANWEQLLVDAAVIGGRDRWARRLKGLEKEFQEKLRELKGDDEARHETLQTQLVRLRNLEKFALPLIQTLDELPTEALWSDWLRALEGLAGVALSKPDTVLELLAELRAMGEVGPVGIEEVKQALGERLSSLRTEPPRSRFGGVFVATIAEVAGRSFEIVFLPGLAEGIFPRKALEDPLLLDVFRRRLGLQPALDQRRTEERLLLRQAVAAASRKLVVSYPRMDVAQGRSRVPSFYALDVLRAAEGRLPDVRKLEKRAAEASNSRLGWPAPQEPSQAIDEAEYDLALLDPLLGSVHRRSRGQARFMLESNQCLDRSLRARWRRWSKKFTESDGVFDPDPNTLQALATQRVRVRSYSPTALQQFAVCPYKFLLHSIHRLHPREEAVAIEQMDPLTRGGLFHEVQFRLFKQLRELGLLPVTGETVEEILRIADETLDAVAREKEDELAPAIPRIWASEVEEINADLRGWIRELERGDNAWVPYRFELAFGLKEAHTERDEASVEKEVEILDRIRVRGSIDLVESNRQRETIRVVDHKTGKAPPESSLVVKGGEILQPLLYALAAEKLLGRAVESGQLFYCTQRGDYKRIEVPINGDNAATLKTVLGIIDGAVKNGLLPAAPRKDACAFCDYSLVCGPHEEQRTARKNRDPLVQLEQLREMH